MLKNIPVIVSFRGTYICMLEITFIENIIEYE